MLLPCFGQFQSRNMILTFEEIYKQYNSLVYNLALHYVQNAEDAQEITQDVFVSIHQSLHSFQSNSAPSTWVYRIAINKSLDFLKAQKRKKRFAFIISLFRPNSAGQPPDAPEKLHPGILLEQKESLQRLLDKINELPDNQKTALILHKIEQKTQAEVGEIMNLSPKAVESLIQRAKTNLSKKLDSSEG